MSNLYSLIHLNRITKIHISFKFNQVYYIWSLKIIMFPNRWLVSMCIIVRKKLFMDKFLYQEIMVILNIIGLTRQQES
jgi:hypothetical protein